MWCSFAAMLARDRQSSKTAAFRPPPRMRCGNRVGWVWKDWWAGLLNIVAFSRGARLLYPHNFRMCLPEYKAFASVLLRCCRALAFVFDVLSLAMRVSGLSCEPCFGLWPRLWCCVGTRVQQFGYHLSESNSCELLWGQASWVGHPHVLRRRARVVPIVPIPGGAECGDPNVGTRIHRQATINTRLHCQFLFNFSE